MSNRIDITDFERLFKYEQESLPAHIRDEITRTNSSYQWADISEFSEYILGYLKTLNQNGSIRSKDDVHASFEKGWMDNYERMIEDGISLESLKPGYFRGNKFLRYDNRLIVSPNLNIEFDLFKIARQCIFDKYLKGFETICELGCGSCQNILMLADLFDEISIIGIDWTTASKKIADYIGTTLCRDIKGYVMDLYAPVPPAFIPPSSAILTIHAFEQLGCNFEPSLNFILDANPALVVNYEPIIELFSDDNLLDYLAIKYFRKRNYLSGYLDCLRGLERDGKIEILNLYRPFLGGVLHDSSIIVWRPHQ